MQLTSQQFTDAFLATLVMSAVFVVGLMLTFAASLKNGRWSLRGRWQYRFSYYRGVHLVHWYCTALGEADAYSSFSRAQRALVGTGEPLPEPVEVARRWVLTRQQLENVTPPPSAGGASPGGGREGVDALPPAGHVPCAPGAQCLGSVPQQVKASRQIGKTACPSWLALGFGAILAGLLFFGAGQARAATTVITGGFTLLYHGPDGSHYSYSFTATHTDHTASTNSWLSLYKSTSSSHSPRTEMLAVFYSYNPQGTQTYTGSVTVAPGEYWGAIGQYLQSANPNIGATSMGTWTPVGTVGPGPEVKDWQTQLKYYNDKPYPVTVKIWKNGELLTTQTVGANSLWAHTVQDEAVDKPVYTWAAGVDGLALTNEQWQAAPTGTFHTAATGTISADKVAEELSSHTPSDANTTTIPTATNLPSSLPTGAGSASVWRNSVASGNTTYTGPTDATFREGIDKITSRQDQQIAAEKEKKTAADADKKAWQDNQKQSDWEAKLTEKMNAGKAAVMDNISGGGVTTPDVATPGGSAWDIPIGNTTVNIYPTGNVLTGMHIVRVFMQAILIYWWIYYMQGECRSVLRSVGLAPQARGNTVAGTGGQVTALLASTVITIALLGVPVAMAALTDNGIGWRQTVNFFGAFTDGTGGTIASMSWQLVCECFPVLTFVTILNNVIIFKAAGTAIMYGVMIAVRWIVPALVGLLAFHTPETEASVRWHNQTSEAVMVEQVRGLWSSTVPAESYVELPPQGGSQYRVTTPAGVKTPVEVLDEAEVYVMPDGAIFTSHPTASWLTYVWRGFVVGMLWNIGGYFFRRFAAMGGSLEAAS